MLRACVCRKKGHQPHRLPAPTIRLDLKHFLPLPAPQADKTVCTYVQPGYASGSGGTQATLVPVAAVAIIVYVVGYPLALGIGLWRNKEAIIEDQVGE